MYMYQKFKDQWANSVVLDDVVLSRFLSCLLPAEPRPRYYFSSCGDGDSGSIKLYSNFLFKLF